ncbi:HlyD family secretion protein [Corallococcus terminator]
MSARLHGLKHEDAPGTDSAPPISRGWRDTLMLGAFAAAVILATGWHALLTRHQETTDNAQVEADVVPLSSRLNGRVSRVHVADNAFVREGELLLQFDAREFEIRVKQAEAELDAARAQEAAAEARAIVGEAGARGGHSTARAVLAANLAATNTAEAQILVARAALRRADAEAHRMKQEFERARVLLASGVLTLAAFETAEAASESSLAALAGAQAQLTSVEQAQQTALSKVAEARGQLDQSAPVDAKIAVARADAALARARTRGAEATLAEARLLLEYTQIRAPMSGQVSKLSVNSGQLLSSGQPVAKLVSRKTHVVANFKETQVGDMRPGQQVEVSVDAYPGVGLKGVVESIAGGTGARFSLLPQDNASGNFVKIVQRVPVRISWADLPPGLPLYAGLSVEVTVFTSRSHPPTAR